MQKADGLHTREDIIDDMMIRMSSEHFKAFLKAMEKLKEENEVGRNA